MPRKGTSKRPVKKDQETKAQVFVGSSGESAKIARAVHLQLRHEFTVTPWTAGVFEPGKKPLAVLEEQATRSSFGVFVFEPDDAVISRGQKKAAVRDNVLFELGLFIGRLGSDNCFFLVPRNRHKLRIPSDLEGYSPVEYEDERVNQEGPEVAVAAACTQIAFAIARRAGGQRASDAGQEAATAAPAEAGSAFGKEAGALGRTSESVAFKFLPDLLGMVRSGKAGLVLRVRDEKRSRDWVRVVLHMALQTVKDVQTDLPEDAYVAWLRPTAQKPGSLSLYESENLPVGRDQHYEFDAGEGLAGTVWSTRQPASHFPSAPHPKWLPRPGCRNASYVCIPVGNGDREGGVLALGSDTGFARGAPFEDLLRPFAGVLSLLASGRTGLGQGETVALPERRKPAATKTRKTGGKPKKPAAGKRISSRPARRGR